MAGVIPSLKSRTRSLVVLFTIPEPQLKKGDQALGVRHFCLKKTRSRITILHDHLYRFYSMPWKSNEIILLTTSKYLKKYIYNIIFKHFKFLKFKITFLQVCLHLTLLYHIIGDH